MKTFKVKMIEDGECFFLHIHADSANWATHCALREWDTAKVVSVEEVME